MLRVVREFADRYAQHRALAGLALRLSARGYAQLPGPDWGMDDGTIARFQRDARRASARRRGRTASPPAPPSSTATSTRRNGSSGGPTNSTSSIAASSRRWPPGIAGRRSAWPGPKCSPARKSRPNCGPSSRRETPWSNRCSTRASTCGNTRRTTRSSSCGRNASRPRQRLGTQAIDLEINQMPDADEGFRNLPCPGSLFFHCPEEARVVSPDQQGPLKSAYTWLLTQAAPSEAENRRRFVHSLAAMDSQILLDGGWMLTMGQEESMRDVTAIYRRLPAVRFTAAGDRSDESQSQPVTFRYAACQGRTYMYAVNDAPFAVAAQVQVDAPQGCQLQALSDARLGGALRPDKDGFQWQVELGPYELAAATLSEPGRGCTIHGRRLPRPSSRRWR